MSVATNEGHTPPKEIAKVMTKDEKLLWFDHPDALSVAQTKLKSLMMAVPFFIFSVIWFKVFLKPTMPPYMDIIGWIFAGFGVWQFAVPLWSFVVAKLFMFYAITDQRLLVIQFYPKSKVKAVAFNDLVSILKLKGGGKSGTLIFEVPDMANKKATKEGQFVKPGATFYGISNVDRIEDAVNQLRGVKPTPSGAPRAPG